jgi:hypothetical protein
MAKEKDAPKTFWVEAVPYGSASGKGDVVGYMNHRRIKVGEKLQVTEQQFSKKWMQRIPEKKAKEASEEEQDTRADKNRRKTEEEESVI